MNCLVKIILSDKKNLGYKTITLNNIGMIHYEQRMHPEAVIGYEEASDILYKLGLSEFINAKTIKENIEDLRNIMK